MLKWAVNGPIRHTYLGAHETEKLNMTGNKVARLLPSSDTKRIVKRPLKRKSSSTYDVRLKVSWHGENGQHFTSTPLQRKQQKQLEQEQEQEPKLRLQGSSKRLHFDMASMNSTSSLRNRSNVTAFLKEKPEVTPERNLPTSYASTLPTFDVEYSPCNNNLIPGPLLALRGIGLPDTYFEKPRYLNSHTPRPHQDDNDDEQDEESLSSSRMDDSTLERMIDAILASTRKDRKLQKSMSPTYTPAHDPASDLHELWDKRKKRSCSHHLPNPKRHVIKLEETPKQEEKESIENNCTMTLRRQRAIRRKRNSLRKRISIQKLLPSNHSNSNQYNSSELEEQPKKILESHSRAIVNRISPDSGHNSVSDYEEDNKENIPVNEMNSAKLNATFDVTKRRLSFSVDDF